MSTYSPEAVIIAQGAMIHAIIHHLESKGLINDTEFTALLNQAIASVQDRDDAADCIAVIEIQAGIHA